MESYINRILVHAVPMCARLNPPTSGVPVHSMRSYFAQVIKSHLDADEADIQLDTALRQGNASAPLHVQLFPPSTDPASAVDSVVPLA